MITYSTYVKPLSSLRKNFFAAFPLALHQDIEDIPVLIHCPREIMPVAADREETSSQCHVSLSGNGSDATDWHIDWLI
jgi:hypothetical protein